MKTRKEWASVMLVRKDAGSIWDSITFSDEKKWNLDGPDGFQHYWRDLRKEPRHTKRRQAGGGSVMMPVSRRVSVMVQHQEMLGNRYSMCGLLSINNSLQQRDFLTAGAMNMKPVLAQLSKVRPSEDHGHPQYGAYTIDALQKGVQKLGKQLHYLNTKSGFKSRPKRPGRIIRSRKPALIVIGQRPGQQKGTWHCIVRAG
ncbi:transposable element Tc3 Transposase putative [Phytophthora palmivora]|uniref:Transposable element Tc3 Transposase putative n=1 Tax=Phytophthora palmivora TaxID=4796 RepID=A0A2P4Y950_9STRA|nr:transposable element Tc3 Transposase putative [Phytophthora palmivora]